MFPHHDLQNRLIPIFDQHVLVDRDVAEIYGVATKRINEAVKNNPDKFPKGYCFRLRNKAKNELVEKFDRFQTLKHSGGLPRVFTEKGLYMLATILKSKQAVEATFAIIETYSQLRALQQTVTKAAQIRDDSQKKSLLQQGGALMAELLDSSLEASESETQVELNFALLKLKHITKRKKIPEDSS